MNYYQIVAFAQHLKKENMNNNFINDPNEFTTDVMNEDSLMNQYFDMIKGHDYSHMFSDDNRSWLSGTKSEKQIKELLHALISVCRVDAERLLEDSLYEVNEQYVDGLTHKTIRNWFKPYVENVDNIFTKPNFK